MYIECSDFLIPRLRLFRRTKASSEYTCSLYDLCCWLPACRVVHVRDSEAPQLRVELTSCSQCPSCKSLLYDEVIMANWSSSDADYKTTCPYCRTRLVASLTITTKQVHPPPLLLLSRLSLFIFSSHLLLFPPLSLSSLLLPSLSSSFILQ